jgi:acetyltransferase
MDMSQTSTLPEALELPYGPTITIRRIQPGDAPLLAEMFGHLSDRTRRLRFHAYTANLPQERIWRQALALAELDPDRELALVAVHEDETGQHIVGVARFARATPEATEAEAAIVVRDDFQRKGLGTHLMRLLLPRARDMGIQRLFGWVMAENRHMLGIVKKTHLPIRVESHSGEMLVVVDLDDHPQ